ncbi:unnamed protein product [Rhizoctonia solani]|uniref:Homeobox domain-containing protein n=1 Tax=Rhizoctonia solani TaxID=456999 RepID=A0A8H2XI96_9AGAM|nr:unnamed protein product [Rhizoctonia solani]
MSQQPSDHYKRSIQVPVQDSTQRGVQVYPVERGNELSYRDPRGRTNSSVTGSTHPQQWHSVRGESPQGAPRSDHHAAQHQMLADAYFRKEEGGDFERVPWREGASQTAGGFYTQDSHHAPFLSSPPTTFQPLRDRQHQVLTWDPNAQERRHSESGYDHAHSFQPPPGSRSDTTSTILRGSASPMNRDYEHHRPSAASRHPSAQSFGPYTTTVLQSGRSSAALSGPGNHRRSHSPSRTPYSSQQQCQQGAHNPEAAVRSTETQQYVVPSSRIPRADLASHTPPAGYYDTTRVSHSPEELSETKPKRRRANAAQLKLLNDTYSRTMFPTTEERADIARRINMTPRQVQIWFQNRRQASRQSQLEHEASSGSNFEGIYNEEQTDYLHGPEDD